MKILFVSLEVVPFAKVGGLGDVAGSLPKAIHKLDHDIRIILPKHKVIDDNGFELDKIAENIEIPIDGSKKVVDIYQKNLPKTNIPVYFVANDHYFDRHGIYDDNGKQYHDDLERYVLFSRSVLHFIKEIDWKPDVIHCNDWHTALIIMYLKTTYKDDPFFKGIATIYSTHNMGYQGIFPVNQLKLTGFDKDHFPEDNIELRGKVDLAKSAFVYSDLISTVSEQFSKEIQTKEFGYGLDPIVKKRANDVYGIINGLDYDYWGPENDLSIKRQYSINNIKGKQDNKQYLQRLCDLKINDSVPLIGIVSRFADQKGFDILENAMKDIMKLDLQMVILGVGEAKYHKKFIKLEDKYKNNLSVHLKFDADLAKQIYAGSDMFLMPSKYEPCGLGQLISYKYGTIPIVRKTGGFVDTVSEYDPVSGKGSGFMFEKYSSKELLVAVRRAIEAYKNQGSWKKLMVKVMEFDYSWDRSAKKYVELYNKALVKTR